MENTNQKLSFFDFRLQIFGIYMYDSRTFFFLSVKAIEQTVLDSFLFEMISIRRIKEIDYEEEKCWIDVLVLVQFHLVDVTKTCNSLSFHPS